MTENIRIRNPALCGGRVRSNLRTIINTLLKRAARGRLPLKADAASISNDFENLMPVAENDPDALVTQKDMLNIAKTLALDLIGDAINRFNGDLRPHQELAGIFSDMRIEIYAFESAYLRTCKMNANQTSDCRQLRSGKGLPR